MRSLVPRDTLFEDLFDFRRDFDRVFNRLLNRSSSQEDPMLHSGFAPAVETSIDKDRRQFRCQVMLPGVDPNDVNIQVLGNNLSISGERSSSQEKKEADYFQREIVYGSFQRTIPLPQGVETDKLNAEYRNGILEITAPISALALPRRIEIKSLPAAKGARA